MRYCQNEKQPWIPVRRRRFSGPLLPAARRGACCFLRGIFLFNYCVLWSGGSLPLAR